jgi:hypothetical protein
LTNEQVDRSQTSEPGPEQAGGTAPPVSEGLDRGDEYVHLPLGHGLNQEEAADVTRASRTILVLVCGPHRSGKTTLISSIYEKFGEGSYAGQLFAGSLTLMGLEQRCFKGRTSSLSAAPETDRTSIDDPRNFMHLRVRSEGREGRPRDLLLPDMSGELFEAAAHISAECKKLDVLLRADRISVLVDGGDIKDRARRHQARALTDSFFRRCVENEMFTVSSVVDLVFTKWDLVSGADDEADIESFATGILEQIRATYLRKVKTIEAFRVAARPLVAGTLPFAHGLDELFKAWLDCGDKSIERLEDGTTIDSDRIFDLVADRWDGQS